MRIAHIDIQNFRKLKCCRVELSEKETVFVGANNSGKTSAMDALMLFLKKSKRKNLSITDFTLSNWSSINQIGSDWVTNTDKNKLNLSNLSWEPLVPSIDIWLQVEDNKIHYVSHIIPTLNWSGGLLGIRLIFEPEKVDDLYKNYIAAYTTAKNTNDLHKAGSEEGKKTSLALWPRSMRDFLDKELHKYFVVRAYVLDPAKYNDTSPQILPLGSEPVDGDPFEGLFKIDIINAQRGFSDTNAGEGSQNTDRRLSTQLMHYFDKHLDPTELPDVNDLDALEAIEAARTAFDDKLKTSFHPAISELEGLNYPGFSDPQIVLSSKMNPLEGLNHDAAIQFHVIRDTSSPDLPALCLPEKYNGLGYQNLISMIFNLIRFRDEWMRVGKAGKRKNEGDSFIEPLHLVLVEEPEAHLHAQVQQVFIKKAYGVLRKHKSLGDNKQFSTQMVVSTHSSHIAHEIDFTCLRYFQRKPATSANDVPCASVVNLTTTFGSNTDTSKFATRYLKTTHCDLFFADAAILVEGPAERMLIPHFIRHKFPELDRSYISLLEIGGSHAHRLKPLIEALGLLTLVVTDLDSIRENTTGKVPPERGKNYRTGNDTLKNWAPRKTQLDEVLDADAASKAASDGVVRIAYQCEMPVAFKNNKTENAIPYTFEDALVLSNLALFRTKSSSTGLMKKMVEAANASDLNSARSLMFGALENGKKAEMALDLLYTTEPNELQLPIYINEGLEWLKDKLGLRTKEFFEQNTMDGNAS
jgi:predicted ATP-dependent endonuclease of OLD family